MVRKYSAFLLRYWQLAADEHRLEITHVQTGGRLLTSSTDAMLAWVRDQLDAEARYRGNGETSATASPGRSGGPGPPEQP